MLNLFSHNNKVFCIGRSKTGTTSLEKALKDLGFKMGDQSKAELLIKNYAKGDWKPIIKYCNSAVAFQDIPFSLPYTWLILHHYFPNAKFILTVRDANAWYSSLVNFHSKIYGGGMRIPTKEDLQNATYRYPGFSWDTNRAIYKTPEDDVYNKEMLIQHYNNHNYAVEHFFKDKKNFIKIDVSENNSYLKLCDFLHKKPLYEQFPHLNIT